MAEDGEQEGITERVAAILAADAVGYSRLMADDEKATIAALDRARALFAEHVEANHGHIVDTAGDSVLSVFKTTNGAVLASLAIQDGLAALNAEVPEARRMRFRIGIHLGDIHEKTDGTIYGDGVNVAARLESLCEPGEVTVSGSVHDSIRDRLGIGFAFLGEHKGKNLKTPVRAFRLLPEGAEVPPVGHVSRNRLGAIAAATVLAVVLAGVAWWQSRPPEPAPMIAADDTPTEEPAFAMPTGPTIAVLPFDNIGADPAQDYFADGLTEDLIAALTRFRHLFVFARNTTFRYKGDAVDVAELRQDLGADYVIDGSVRIAEERVRVVVQLVDAESGGQMWTETFDDELDNVFDVQSNITARIVGSVAGSRGRLAEVALDEASSTRNLAAYDHVLRAQKYYRSFSGEDHVTALSHLEQAVDLDPEYALAYAHLAQLLIHEYAAGYTRLAQSREKAEAAAQRAVALAPSDAFAHFALAHVYSLTNQKEKLIEEIDRVLALNPNDAHAIGDLGVHMIYFGEPERGLWMVEKAYELNPGYTGYYRFAHFHIHYLRGEYEKALEHAEANVTVDYWRSHMLRVAAYSQLGRMSEARSALEALLKLRPDFPDIAVDTLRKFYPHEPLRAAMLDGLTKAGLFDEPGPSRPVIAVLPFDNLSGDPEQEYFADGITEDIITRLAQYPDILVLGRNTTFQFKGEAVDIPTVAAQMGADYVVEGSIRRGGDTVRVTAQLLGAEVGAHLWAETFDRALDVANLFSIQDEITETVASRIGDVHGVVSRAQSAQGNRQAPSFLTSYDCILRAHEFVRQVAPETHHAARDCLESVIEVEPDYAEALAYLGNLYLLEIAVGLNRVQDSSLDRALSMAERAVFVDPNSGIAHVIYAQALYLTDDPQRAIREAEEALRLEPNNSDIIGWAGEVLSNTGAYERTAEIMDRLTILNPKYPAWMN